MKIIKKIIIIVGVVLIGFLYATGNWSDAIYDTNVNGANYESLKNLDDNIVVEQEFTCKHKGLDGFRIRFSTLNRRNIGKYSWQLIEKSTQKIIEEGNVDFTKVNSKGEYRIDFDKLEESAGNEYTFKIQAQNVSEDEAITLYKTSSEQLAGSLYVDGNKTEGSTILKMYCHRFDVETFVVFCGFALYLAVFIWFMTKLFK